MLDIDSLSKAVYNRIKKDEQGLSIRDAYGGIVGIIKAEQLSRPGLPGRPLLAFRDGVLANVSRGHRQPLYQWYVYDERVQGYARINALLKLLIDKGVCTPDEWFKRVTEEYEWLTNEKAEQFGVEVTDAGIVYKNPDHKGN